MPDIHDDNIKTLGGGYAAQIRAGNVRRNDAMSQWGAQRKLVKDYTHDVRVIVKDSAEQPWMRFKLSGIAALDEEDLHLRVDVDGFLGRCLRHHSHLS